MKRSKQKGITLIALVITIIVLLILAGVSIATLTGQNGILTQANNAKENSEISEEKEAVSLAYTGVIAEKKGEGTVTANDLNIQFGLNIQMGNDVSLSIQSIFDEICPKIIPLLSTFGVYYALKKNVKPTTVMIFMIVIAIAFKYFGIM